jgi:hypothetical protein
MDLRLWKRNMDWSNSGQGDASLGSITVGKFLTSWLTTTSQRILRTMEFMEYQLQRFLCVNIIGDNERMMNFQQMD